MEFSLKIMSNTWAIPSRSGGVRKQQLSTHSSICVFYLCKSFFKVIYSFKFCVFFHTVCPLLTINIKFSIPGHAWNLWDLSLNSGKDKNNLIIFGATINYQ